MEKLTGFLFALTICGPLHAQVAPGHVVSAPASRTVRDAQDHLSFQIPAGWSLAMKDGELSTFRAEARTAPANAKLRYVAAIGENPFPTSTFSGAHFYVSVTPNQTAEQCTAQAVRGVKDPPRHYLPSSVPQNRSIVAVGSHLADHGHDESGDVCTEIRDEIYTVRVKNACFRFDLAMNNFCGEAAGVRDMNRNEILDVRGRLEGILGTVKFDR